MKRIRKRNRTQTSAADIEEWLKNGNEIKKCPGGFAVSPSLNSRYRRTDQFPKNATREEKENYHRNLMHELKFRKNGPFR
jgi:hypothetical protein